MGPEGPWGASGRHRPETRTGESLSQPTGPHNQTYKNVAFQRSGRCYDHAKQKISGQSGYVMNLHAYDSLPEDLQAVVTHAANEAGRKTNTAMIQAFRVQLSEMKKHGMKVTELQPGTASYKAFQDALAPLAKRDEKRFPESIVHAVLRQER